MTKTGDFNRLKPMSDAQWNARNYRVEASQMQGPGGWGNKGAIAEVDRMVRGATGQFMSADEYRHAVAMLQTARNFEG